MFPSSWTQSTIGELCEMVKGASQIVRTKPGQYPLVTTGEERKTADHFQFDTAVVCVPMISAFGHGKAGLKRVQYQEGKFALANILTALIVRDQSRFLPRFLHLYLNYYKDELIVPLQSGAANMGITVTKLATVPIAFPSLDVQQRIIHLIAQADEINQLRASADTRTDDFVPALFNEMFGDPATNPKGWNIVSIGQITSLITSGFTPRGGRRVYIDQGPYFLRSQNVQMNSLDLSDAACLPAEIRKTMERVRVGDGDLLLNITGASIGRVTWVEHLEREAYVSQHVCIIRINDTNVMPQYASFCLSTPHCQGQINRMQSGASRQGLNHQQVRRLQIPLPPLALQREFAARVAEVRALQAQQSRSRQRLEDLFQALLHRAFAGEL